MRATAKPPTKWGPVSVVAKWFDPTRGNGDEEAEAVRAKYPPTLDEHLSLWQEIRHVNRRIDGLYRLSATMLLALLVAVIGAAAAIIAALIGVNL